MKISTYVIKLLFFLFILTSCTKEIDLKPDNQQNQLVLNSIITPDILIKVRLSDTKRITDSSQFTISSAFVTLFEDDVVKDTLHYINNGTYISKFKPSVMKNYSIAIEDINYPAINAKESIPKKIQLANATFKYIGKRYNKAQQDYIETLETSLSFNDPPSEKNYYEIIFYHYIGSNIDYFNQTNLFFDNPIILNEGDVEYGITTLLFSDELFDGKSFTYINKIPFRGSFSNGQARPDTTFVSFRSISYNYYKYRKTWTRHKFNQNSEIGYWQDVFKGEPITMFTNVQNGYGIFCGYEQDVKQLTFIP